LKLSDDPVARKLVNKAASLRNLDLVLNSGAPPEVSIVSPKPESRSADMNVVVEAKISVKSAADKGGGIGRVEWRVNGITKEVQNVDRPAESTTGGLNLKHFFALGEGENLIEIIAYNHENLVASPPSRVLVAVESSTPRPRPNLHVLAVGIDKYRYDVLNLKYAAADAKAISAAFGLPNAGKDIYEQIFVHDPLLDEQVTAENLKKKLEEIGKEMRPDDVFVLYMAGHAVTDAVLGRHFIPHDGNYENQDREKLIATSIGQDQLQEWLALIPALRSVLIFDACESEQTTSDFTPFRVSQKPVAVANLSKASGRTMLAATTGFGAALEGYNGHGIFTYVLLEALAQADADKNGKIETKELENYLVSRLPELTEELSKQSPNTAFKRQVPQINVVGAGFTLVNRADILNQPAAVVQP
jgi:hypothetical protein